MDSSGVKVIDEGRHRLIQGDALLALGTVVPDGTADLVFADPPYNLGKQAFRDSWTSEDEYLRWCREWLRVCCAKLKPTGALYLMNSTQNMPHLDLFLRQHLHVLARIVWCYDSSGVQARKYFGSLYEPILYAVKDRRRYTFNADDIQVEARTGAQRKLIDYRKPVPAPYNSLKVPGNVWTFPRVRFRMPEYEKHPAQKPEALLERIIRASTKAGETVLDPFAGTFTAAVVAERLGRSSISIEVKQEYVQIGLDRLRRQAAVLFREAS